MSEFEFTLTFALPDRAVETDDLIEKLGAAGCDEALVGVGRWGRLALSFRREAETATTALASALADVRRAEPQARLIEAAPDFVGLTDVAALLGVTRQNVRNLILSCDAPAPVPVHEGKPTIWHFAKVLTWLREHKGYRIPQELVELAGAAMQVNLAVEAFDADGAAQQELAGLLR